MIVVATADFEVYHDVVNELRDRGVSFTTIEPGADLPERTTVLIVGPDDEIDEPSVLGNSSVPGEPPVPGGPSITDAPSPEEPNGVDVEIVRVDGDSRRAVEQALSILRGGDRRTIIGVDPGDRPGIAVLSGPVVVAAYHVPLSDAASVISDKLDGSVDPLVRIGDGARIQGAKIVNELEGVRIELVDETGTTPSLGTGARGMGDVLAAANIARLEGEEIETREIEPTEGEIQVIKNRSRERSDENRTITGALAKRVATGDLTLEEAIDEHGSDSPDESG